MAHESIINLTADNFESEVTGASVPVLVDFWAEWCGPCKMLGPVLDELAEDLGATAKICKVDVQSNQELAAKYDVSSIPLLLFFKDGEKVDEVLGLTSKDNIAGKLQALA